MIRIELLSPSLDGHSVHWERLGILEAEGRDLTWHEGNESLLDFTVPVMDLRGQRSLHFEEDQEEWVRSLWTIFRGGDIVINVIEDTNPLTSNLFETPNDGDEPINVQPADAHVGAGRHA